MKKIQAKILSSVCQKTHNKNVCSASNDSTIKRQNVVYKENSQ